MHELQVILEDLRNQLAVIKGYVQINMLSDSMHQKLLLEPLNNADILTAEALNILRISRFRDNVL